MLRGGWGSIYVVSLLSVNELHIVQEKHRVHFEKILEEERKIKSYQEIQEKELTDFKTLLDQAVRWHHSILLRNYLIDIEEKEKAKGNISVEFQEWLIWAKAKANWYDPLVEEVDPLLQTVDRKTLSFKKDETY